jgi:hypothetical protein
MLILGTALLSGVTGWKLNTWKHSHDREQQVLAHREALGAVAEEIAKLDVVNKTIHQKVVERVVEKPVYRDCKHDPDTYRLLNDALAGVGLAGQGVVPKGVGVVD